MGGEKAKFRGIGLDFQLLDRQHKYLSPAGQRYGLDHNKKMFIYIDFADQQVIGFVSAAFPQPDLKLFEMWSEVW